MATLNTTLTSTTGFPNAVAIYYDRKLLERLELDFHLEQFGEKRTLPKGVGNQITFTRYSNFAASTTALTEGTVPNGETLQSIQINVTPVQYGNYVTLSDQLLTEAIDPVIKSSIDVLGYQAALSLDTIIQTGLHGTITSQFAGSATTEAGTSAVVTAAEIRRAVFKLKKSGVRELTGGYAGCFHPASAFDIMSDTAVGGWLDVNKYTVTGPTYNGEIGKIYGCRIVESQNIQTGTGESSATTYRNFVFGKQCYGLVDLAGHNLKMIAKQLGTSGAFDPLDQLSTVGYKFSFVLAILDALRGIEVIGCTSAS